MAKNGIWSGNKNGEIKFWDFDGTDNRCLKTFRQAYRSRIECLALDKNGIWSGNDDGRIKFWNFEGTCVRTLKGLHSTTYTIWSITLCEYGLWSTSNNGCFHLWREFYISDYHLLRNNQKNEILILGLIMQRMKIKNKDILTLIARQIIE